MFIIPTWLIIILGGITLTHRLYIAKKYDYGIVSKLENYLYAIALANVTLFYLGVAADLWDPQFGVMLSRIVWTWLLIVSLIISHNMAMRNKK